MTAEPNLATLRSLCERVAREAGRLLHNGMTRTDIRVETKRTDTDLVTEMDWASEALITQRLLELRPDDSILGEEGARRHGTSGVRWIVDPLDGTTNYLYGLAGFNVSIGVEVNDQPAAGAVYDIVRDELFSASLGGGATRNGETIQTTSARHLPHALVGTGFSYEPEQRHRQAQVLVTLLPRVRDIRRQGAAALDLCSVACGRLDAYYEQGLAPWDVAAGGLIASEAGAAVTNVAGDAVTAGTVVAAAPGIAPALRRLLRTAGLTDT